MAAQDVERGPVPDRPVAAKAAAIGCPVITVDEISKPDERALWHFENFDRLRESARMYFGEALGHEFWLATHSPDIREVLQDHARFSSHVAGVHNPDPDFMWIPEMLDAPLHTKWRRLLGGLFSPGAVAQIEPRVRELFQEILDDVADRGECDFIQDVALRFPNVIFMELMGLPVSDAAQFQYWETEILHLAPTELDRKVAAMDAVKDYFASLITERRKNVKDDIISKALTFEIDGEPVSDDDLRALFLLLFMAGLDTVAMQLSYSFLHLATHDDDRRRLAEAPSLVRPAVEEFLRYYSFVTPVRKAKVDTEVGGCPVTAGQTIWVPLNLANRDPLEFPDACKVDIAREDNHHIGFGAGPHRCLGSHLARQELCIALEEWHKRIPHYRLKDGVDVREHGPNQIGLNSLSLEWDVRVPGRAGPR